MVFDADLIAVALKEKAADMVIKGGKIVNVYTGEIYIADIAVYKDQIAYVGNKSINTDSSTELVDAEGFYLVPGYIEPHAHLWVIANPVEWGKELSKHGITTAVTDNAGYFALQGKEKFLEMISELQDFAFNFCWNVGIMYATPVSNQESVFGNLGDIWSNKGITGIAEITRWKDILNKKKRILNNIQSCHDAGKIVEVHTAGVSYEKLNAITAGGAHGDHEPINVKQVYDRMRLGLWTMLRHSSLRQDIDSWISVLHDDNMYLSRLMLTTDGSSPMYVNKHGSMDYVLTRLVKEGVDPITALRLATINPATFYRMDDKVGGIAPRRRADILFLKDLKNFTPQHVIMAGKMMVRDGKIIQEWPKAQWEKWGIETVQYNRQFAALQANYSFSTERKTSNGYPVMDLVSTVITRPFWTDLPEKEGKVDLTAVQGLHLIALIQKDGQWATQGVIKGFAEKIDGYASSYSVNGNMLVIGKEEISMAQAGARVAELGGGIVLVEDGKILFELPLPLAGIMNDCKFSDTAVQLKKMQDLLEDRGYKYEDFLYTTLFLPCDHLPDWRITEYGMLDVKRGNLVYSV